MSEVDDIIRDNFPSLTIVPKLIKSDFRSKMFKLLDIENNEIFWLKYWGGTGYKFGNLEIDILKELQKQFSGLKHIQVPRIYSFEKFRHYFISYNFNGIDLHKKLIKNAEQIDPLLIAKNIYQWLSIFQKQCFTFLNNKGTNSFFKTYNRNISLIQNNSFINLNKIINFVNENKESMEYSEKVIVHTDFNASNILINNHNEICVLDFTGTEIGTVYSDISFFCASLYSIMCSTFSNTKKIKLFLNEFLSLAINLTPNFNGKILKIEILNSLLTKIYLSYTNMKRSTSIKRKFIYFTRLIFFQMTLKKAMNDTLFDFHSL